MYKGLFYLRRVALRERGKGCLFLHLHFVFGLDVCLGRVAGLHLFLLRCDAAHLRAMQCVEVSSLFVSKSLRLPVWGGYN